MIHHFGAAAAAAAAAGFSAIEMLPTVGAAKVPNERVAGTADHAAVVLPAGGIVPLDADVDFGGLSGRCHGTDVADRPEEFGGILDASYVGDQSGWVC